MSDPDDIDGIAGRDLWTLRRALKGGVTGMPTLRR
jgi:hypothetical protein